MALIVRLIESHMPLPVTTEKRMPLTDLADSQESIDNDEEAPPETKHLMAVSTESPSASMLCWEWDPDVTTANRQKDVKAALQWLSLAQKLST
jgi:hypothetical protein